MRCNLCLAFMVWLLMLLQQPLLLLLSVCCGVLVADVLAPTSQHDNEGTRDKVSLHNLNEARKHEVPGIQHWPRPI